MRVVAERVQVDGAIRANGQSFNRGAAGGSVWITTGELSGSGAIEAKGGNGTLGSEGSGGGGAIAVEYTTLDAGSTLLDHLQSYGGSTGTTGGAGTVYVRGGSASTYGQLIVDNGLVGGRRRTVLPSLGSGTAGSGSGGATLVTGRSRAIPAYFVGHWVEIRNTLGVLEGTWRIASIGTDGQTVVLASNAGEAVTVDEGDGWQGVYRFDEYTVKGDVQVVSVDPIHVYSEQVIAGTVETDAIYADRLVVAPGATLTQHLTASSTAAESLTIAVRELVVEAGGAIDVSERGYGPGVTYPGAVVSGVQAGGSHLGEGGPIVGRAVGETYGSVSSPRENGAGPDFTARGGGAVRVVAERVQVDGAIRANGQSFNRGAAGGSVWITTGELSGSGAIEAKGGNGTLGSEGSGGGGAIAVEYTTLDAGSTLLDHLQSYGGSTGTTGGAGTVYVRGGSASTYGQLIVDNGLVGGRRRTVLPSLGSGTAGSGSGGATLVTGRSRAIPAYFVGHWVEIRNGAGVLEGTWRIASIGTDGQTVVLASNAGEAVTVDEGDGWQGVYRFDEYTVKGDVQVVSADPIHVYSEQVIAGTVETDAIYADRLVVAPGATLTQHLTASSTAAESLTIAVRELVVEAGGAIDVSERGYGPGVTYPGAVVSGVQAGGSHLGEGGPIVGRAVGETYGSVSSPRENGAGPDFTARGGGAVRVVAERVQVDGAIRANGQSFNRGAAGGSVWITTGELSGSGAIEAKGGNGTLGSEGSGGGGAIAVEYTTLDAGSTLLDHLQSYGGSTGTTGGAGTVYVRGGSASTYGQLIVDNGLVGGHRRTVLPSLGSGTAGSGSGGATLVTGRSRAIPAYFVGHWVEIRNTLGVLEGTWRIASIGTDGQTVVLASNAGEAVTVDEGDGWQGVYRFDEYTVKGDVQVVSVDPIHVYSEQVIAGTVETDAIYADRLVVAPGATLTQHLTASSTAAESLTIAVRELVVEAGGAIDVSERGYGPGVTYPGAVVSGVQAGGSHLGEGGPIVSRAVGETYGSVSSPRENGAGPDFTARGGGAVRVIAERVQVDGAIRANGQSFNRGAAGGSVWITTGELSGSGAIEAKGGNGTLSSEGSGGGGAIAVEYTTLDAGSTLLDHLQSYGGSTGTTGGAGTVYVRGGSASTYGQLIVDNGLVGGHRRTVLPSLGSGTAGSGSGGATLVTGRSRAIPAYFVGHWVEIRNTLGVLEGTWRIASIGTDGQTVVLASNAGEAVTVDEGDGWQGVYRFDEYTVKGDVQVVSADPIHVYSEQVITGTVETDAIYADRLVVAPGATLTQHLTASSTAAESLTIAVRELVVEAGGAIDVSERGYGPGVTYPGAVVSGVQAGGSHLGEGGPIVGRAVGETYGSVSSPRENGAGPDFTARGGGAVRVVAERVQVDGAIRANGQSFNRGAAGGSVWITTGELSGSGAIEAKGGNGTLGSEGSGGGGAIAVEYTTLDAGSTLLDHLQSYGGSTGTTGGAGTIYLHGPDSTLGSLLVSNGAVTGNRRTVLPSLGRGIVQGASADGTVLTGRDASIPAYFVGHWFEVEGQDRFVKGVWRIASVDGTSVTLEPKAGYPFDVIAAGDRWRGLYRFDEVTVASGSVLVSTDAIIQLVPPLPDTSVAFRSGKAVDDGSEAIYGNDEAPAWVKADVSIAVGSVPGSYRIVLAPGAVSDPDGISEVRLTSGGRSLGTAWSAEGAAFLWSGYPGQLLHLVAIDAHSRVQRAGWLELPPLPTGDGWPPQLELGAGVTPRAASANADWLGIGDEGIWFYGSGAQPVVSLPPHEEGERVVDLAADGDRFLVATDRRIDEIDLATPAVSSVPIASGRVLDLAAGSGEAVVLLTDDGDSGQPVLRLAQVSTPASGAPSLLGPSELALPILSEPRLERTSGAVHLFGLDADGQGILYTWPASALGELLGAEPTVFELPGGWRGVGAWQEGAVLLAPQAVRLLRYGAAGWSEVARIDLDAEPVAAAVAGSRLVVLVPGEIRVYDLGDPAAPVLAASYPGASYRAIEPLPDGDVLLWSPPLAAPPLRWDPATAVPGSGFTTVIDGLP